MEKSYDLLILGGGPGGYVAAIRAAKLGLTVALIEKEAVGGTCLHHGCIPSKTILRNAEVLSLIQRADDFGISVDHIQADFGAAIDRSQKVLNKLYMGVRQLLKKSGVVTIAGFGKLTSKTEIEVTSQDKTLCLNGKTIIIATGSRVQSLPHLKIDGERIITSDDALLRRNLPQSILIVGGGAIGVEFGYIYSVFGVKVTIVEMMPTLLPTEDADVSKLLGRSFRKRGISLRTGKRIQTLRDEAGLFQIDLVEHNQDNTTQPEEVETIEAELILVSVGRAPNSDQIGLQRLGIALDEKTQQIRVDENLKTNIDTIYAIGDVSTRPALAHGAMAQGVAVAEALAGVDRPQPSSHIIPNAVYCHPQVASVGLTEKQALQSGHEIQISKFPLSANGKAIALGETEGFVKIIADKSSADVLGAHIIGAEATELIAEFVLALNLQATGQDLHHSIHAHPTISEAVMEASAGLLGEAIHF